MKYQISLGKCVMLVLGCYLAFVIFRANNKLQLDKIGTIFSTVSEKTVQAGSLSGDGQTKRKSAT